MEVVFIIVGVIIVLYLFGSKNEPKKPAKDYYTEATKESIKRTNDSVERSRKLLEEIRNERNRKIETLENEISIEITGVHIPNRKNRIKRTCEYNQELILEAEPKNKFDSKAIKVSNYDGIIGYVQSEDLDIIHPIINKDHYAYISFLDNESDYITVEIDIKY